MPLTESAFRNLGISVLVAVLAFNIETYSYYRGSVVTPFHSGHGVLLPNGGVEFQIYLDGGAAEAPAHIMKVQLTTTKTSRSKPWNTEMVTRLPAASIHNDFEHNKFKSDPYGTVTEWAQWRPSCCRRSRTFMRPQMGRTSF